MSQLPVTGNAVNNGITRAGTDVKLTLYVRDREQSFFHMLSFVYVNKDCVPDIVRVCEKLTAPRAMPVAPYAEWFTSLLKQLPMAGPGSINHDIANARLLYWAWMGNRGRQEGWQEGDNDFERYKALPTDNQRHIIMVIECGPVCGGGNQT